MAIRTLPHSSVNRDLDQVEIEGLEAMVDSAGIEAQDVCRLAM
jgi:hypothetical protein